MLVEAINNIKYNHIYRMPGTPFDIDDVEGKRLIGLGVITEHVDKKMMDVAKERYNEIKKEIDQLTKKLSLADIENKQLNSKIEKLEKGIETAKDADKKKIISKIKKLEDARKDPEVIKENLDKLGNEIKEFDLD